MFYWFMFQLKKNGLFAAMMMKRQKTEGFFVFAYPNIAFFFFYKLQIYFIVLWFGVWNISIKGSTSIYLISCFKSSVLFLDFYMIYDMASC